MHTDGGTIVESIVPVYRPAVRSGRAEWQLARRRPYAVTLNEVAERKRSALP